MAFEALMTRINLLLNGMEHETQDSFVLLEELHLELNRLKATGQPLPDDLKDLEERLEQELQARADER
jgi:hypothetical protein